MPSERPSVIITDDINRLLQYIHGLEGERQRDNQGIYNHLGEIQKELRGHPPSHLLPYLLSGNALSGHTRDCMCVTPPRGWDFPAGLESVCHDCPFGDGKARRFCQHSHTPMPRPLLTSVPHGFGFTRGLQATVLTVMGTVLDFDNPMETVPIPVVSRYHTYTLSGSGPNNK
jgi:hypothetical protein